MSSSEAKSIHKKVRAEQDKLVPDQVVQDVGRAEPLAEAKAGDRVKPREKGTPDEQFPADYSAKEDKDEMMAARLELQKQSPDTPGVTPFGVMQQTDEDLQWLLRKQRAQEVANFENWFAREYDHMDPASKAWARKALPKFYSKRQALLGQQAKNLQRLAQIKLNGVQSKEDLVTLYAAETGRLDVGPLEHLLNPETSQQKERAAGNFARGLLNPRRFVFGNEGGSQDDKQRAASAAAMFRGRTPNASGQGLGLSTGFPPFGGSSTALGAAPSTLGLL